MTAIQNLFLENYTMPPEWGFNKLSVWNPKVLLSGQKATLFDSTSPKLFISQPSSRLMPP
jgi:hypothetical protein